MRAIALTDLSNVFGAVKFYKAATSKKIKPIIGSDVWLENESNRDQPYRLLLLCQSQKGYLNLSKILSKAYLENQYRNRAEVKASWLLDEFNEDIIVLSGAVRGEVGQYILQDKLNQAKQSLLKWKASFGDRFYIEIQRHEDGKLKINQEKYCGRFDWVSICCSRGKPFPLAELL